MQTPISLSSLPGPVRMIAEPRRGIVTSSPFYRWETEAQNDKSLAFGDWEGGKRSVTKGPPRSYRLRGQLSQNAYHHGLRKNPDDKKFLLK